MQKTEQLPFVLLYDWTSSICFKEDQTNSFQTRQILLYTQRWNKWDYVLVPRYECSTLELLLVAFSSDRLENWLISVFSKTQCISLCVCCWVLTDLVTRWKKPSVQGFAMQTAAYSYMAELLRCWLTNRWCHILVWGWNKPTIADNQGKHNKTAF